MVIGWVYSIHHRKDEHGQPYADVRVIFEGGSSIRKDFKELDVIEIEKKRRKMSKYERVKCPHCNKPFLYRVVGKRKEYKHKLEDENG